MRTDLAGSYCSPLFNAHSGGGLKIGKEANKKRREFEGRRLDKSSFSGAQLNSGGDHIVESRADEPEPEPAPGHCILQAVPRVALFYIVRWRFPHGNENIPSM
jgi:hypothetical protein